MSKESCKKYTFPDNDSVYLVINNVWSRKSIKKAVSGVSTDIAETLNLKCSDYCLIRDDGTFIVPHDDFDVDDIEITVLRWVVSTFADHINFLLG